MKHGRRFYGKNGPKQYRIGPPRSKQSLGLGPVAPSILKSSLS